MNGPRSKSRFASYGKDGIELRRTNLIARYEARVHARLAIRKKTIVPILKLIELTIIASFAVQSDGEYWPHAAMTSR